MSKPTPSWLRWPPNCCETCTSWQPSVHDIHIGTCNSPVGLDAGTTTDSRYRCPSFVRKKDTQCSRSD